MIGSLRGVVLDRSVTGEVLVEVGGVGYRVTVGPEMVASLGGTDGPDGPGGTVFLHIHHHLREDGQTLYGFGTRDERLCFEALLGAHGIGPALALAILSIHDPAALQQVVADDDIDSLCLVPGVGKKTAARLLVELKSALDLPEFEPLVVLSDPSSPPTARSDVREALVGLGYEANEIADVLRDLPDDGDPSLLLREALSRLAVAS